VAAAHWARSGDESLLVGATVGLDHFVDGLASESQQRNEHECHNSQSECHTQERRLNAIAVAQSSSRGRPSPWDNARVARPAPVLLVLMGLAGGVAYMVHGRGPTHCGVSLVASYSGRHVSLSTCDGELVPPPTGITVAVGETVTLDNYGWSGFFSSTPSVLVRRARGGHEAAFRAVAPGAARIEVNTDTSCAARVSTSTCLVLPVTVNP